MYKTLLFFFLGLMALQEADAQKNERDTLFYYIKNSGKVVGSRDSADYSLLIMPRDSTSNLFPVFQYYLNGKRKLSALSHTRSLNLVLEGSNISFFPNGHRSKIMTYNNGLPIGDVIEYYPNGKVYAIKKFEGNKLLLVESRDSTGNVLAENGTGKSLEFDDNYKEIIKEKYFKDGILESERSKSDTLKTWIKIDVQPMFPGGIEALYKFLSKTIRYPNEERKKHITGKVVLTFVVEKNGLLTDIQVNSSPSEGLSTEAIRVMELSPPWIPGSAQGKPARVQFVFPISFSLDGND